MSLKILQLKKVIREIGDLGIYETIYNTDLEEIVKQEKELCKQKKNPIKHGLYADFKPKLLIGYFKIFQRCYLEVQL